ncbi:MAG: hypothetical protein QGH42_09365 [Kiritimatiellia bacterium]|jgi:hypothetical protein|nr:hypothetical protein [Kiritimatiellia bacterium]MDP6811110.1 hypothetical protein [Kiritimatiellia bacterium]MDP7024429.1 hypothetical protein [Kiritimatiellia bacterium]
MRHLNLLLLALLVLSAGCIDFTETLTLNDDGSGLIDITYSLPEETVTQITGMIKLADELASVSGEEPPGDSHGYLDLLLNPSEERIKRKVESYDIDGLAVKDMKVESRHGGRHVKFQLTFDRITDLAKTDFFADQGFTLSRIQGDNYRLLRKGIKAPSEQPIDLEDPQIVRMITPILGGFNATVGVKTPGRVLQANTTRRSLRQAVWNFEFNRDPEDFRSFYTKDLEVVFDGSGLSLPAE